MQLFSILRDLLPPEKKGKTDFQLNDGSTLKDLLKELDINRRVVISVNGIQENDHNRQLCNGDVVKIFTSISGG